MIKKEDIPNFLCYLRIAATPFVVLFLLLSVVFDGALKIAFIVLSGAFFGLAMLTDALDGRYARKHNLISDKGKILDPFADKILIIGSMFAFMVRDFFVGSLAFWYLIPLSVILAREITVSLLRKYTAKKGAVIGASIWGKVKTCIQSVTVALSFFASLFNLNTVIFLLICLAGVITLISLFPYLKMYISKLKELESKQ
jgi:CDP-diacylglycerol--glycerol-3-phosphate 3-phosphatidyltransferase